MRFKRVEVRGGGAVGPDLWQGRVGGLLRIPGEDPDESGGMCVSHAYYSEEEKAGFQFRLVSICTHVGDSQMVISLDFEDAVRLATAILERAWGSVEL